MRLRTIHITLALIIAGLSVSAQQLPLDSVVKTGRLANGFTYYIRHNEEPKHRVTMYLVNKVGSVLEDDDQRGLAHFMEHMSFNGTAHFPHNALVDYLQKAGVRFGADINAYTGFDETVYQLPLPADQPAVLNKGLLIMHDWAQNATLDPSEIDRERGVVLEEKRLGKGSGERMQRQFFPMLMNNSRYAVRLPIGTDTVLNHFKPATIRRFYHDWYRPDLQALVIVGDINADSLEKVVKRQFADLKNPKGEKPRTHFEIPLTGRNQFMAVSDKEMPNTVIEVMIKHTDRPLKSYADYREDIVKNLFNEMIAGRYAELARKAEPPFVQGVGSISSFMGGLSTFSASLTAKPGQLETGFKALWRETERVTRFGFTPTELQRAKTAVLNHMEQALAEKNKTASLNFVEEYQALFLKGTAAPGISKEYELTKADLPGITLDDIKRVGSSYLTDGNRDILVLGPEKDKASLPGQATLNGWVKAVQAENLQPYNDQISSLPLLNKAPISGKIIKQEREKSLQLITYTLSNGVRVIVKPTDYKNDQILFQAFAPGGSSLANDADFQSAASASNIVSASGLGNYDADQLAKYLEDKQVKVNPFIAERYQGISGRSVKKDLPSALEMIYAYFTEARKDTLRFKGIIERSAASLLHRDDDPKNVFSDTVSAILGNHHIRRSAPNLNKLAQVNLDKAYAFYRDRFSDASGFTFVFTGSVDTNTIKPLLEKYLGGLPAKGKEEQAIDRAIHVPEGQIAQNVYKGSEPQSTVLLVYSGKFKYNQSNRLTLDALKECLEIRLLQRLREEESGVYSPQAFVSESKYPDQRYALYIQFGCAPQNVDRLIASAKDEVEKLQSNGPSQENLDKWRAEDKTSTETALKTNSFWSSYLTGQLQDMEPLGQINQYPALRDQIKTIDVREMAKKYLSGNNYIRIVLQPEGSAMAK